jgi:hypothetical protein
MSTHLGQNPQRVPWDIAIAWRPLRGPLWRLCRIARAISLKVECTALREYTSPPASAQGNHVNFDMWPLVEWLACARLGWLPGRCAPLMPIPVSANSAVAAPDLARTARVACILAQLDCVGEYACVRACVCVHGARLLPDYGRCPTTVTARLSVVAPVRILLSLPRVFVTHSLPHSVVALVALVPIIARLRAVANRGLPRSVVVHILARVVSTLPRRSRGRLCAAALHGPHSVVRPPVFSRR